jgi:quercetin dioxygenase-like cupin family protein
LAAAEIGLKKKREDIMIMLRSIKLAIWFAGVLLVGAVMGTQAQAPEPKGPVAKPLLNLDLAPEMDSIDGRVMRMQLTTYEPGASNKPHSHKDRPEVVYILSGKIIEHRGDVAKEYGPGDTFTADRNTNHWMENKGTVPAVMLVTGIAKKE